MGARGSTVWIPPDLNEVLKLLAEIENLSKSDIVRKALELYIDKVYGGVENIKEKAVVIYRQKLEQLINK